MKTIIKTILAVPLTFVLYLVFYVLSLPVINVYADYVGVSTVAEVQVDKVAEQVQAQLATHMSYLLLTIAISSFCLFLATYISSKLVPRHEIIFAVVIGSLLMFFCLYKWFFNNMFAGFPLLYAFTLTFLVPVPSAVLAAKLRMSLHS